jgi:hypothetical protein
MGARSRRWSRPKCEPAAKRKPAHLAIHLAIQLAIQLAIHLAAHLVKSCTQVAQELLVCPAEASRRSQAIAQMRGFMIVG